MKPLILKTLKYLRPERRKMYAFFGLKGFQILPIFNALDFYAAEKTRLRKSGKIIDEFDLLIASTAVANNLIMVTHNQKHFERIKGIKIEDWTII